MMRTGRGSYGSRDEVAEVTLGFKASTPTGNACLFTIDGDRDIWISTKLIDDDEFDPDKVQRGESVTIRIPMWLAVKEGMV